VGKSITDYCAALEFLEKRSPILPTTIHIDFEQYIHSADRLLWSTSKIKDVSSISDKLSTEK